MRVTPIGELNGQLNQPIWTLSVRDVGGLFALSLDATTVRPNSLRIEALLNGVVVDSVVFDPSTTDELARFAPDGCNLDPFWLMEREYWAIVELASAGLVTLFGSTEVTADTLVASAVAPTDLVGSLSETRMEVVDIPALTLFDESLGLFNRSHRAVGQATMTGAGDHLIVSNLGSSGQDGVSIMLDNAELFAAQLDREMLLAPSDRLTLGATGNFQGVADSALGQTSITRAGANLEVSTDYSALGAGMVRIEVFDDGILSGTTLVPSGVVGKSVGSVVDLLQGQWSFLGVAPGCHGRRRLVWRAAYRRQGVRSRLGCLCCWQCVIQQSNIPF